MTTLEQAASQQEAQEPCPTCAALARTVMLDQVSFDRKPDCYGIRHITDYEGVEEWEDIRTSPDVAREEANDLMATRQGEIYEVVPLYTAPQPAPAPLSEREEVAMIDASIVELEAEREAVGAGGVSGPLMGQPQAMPDLTALTERGAKEWAGVDAQGLREGAASAVSEPVAPSGWREAIGEIRAGLEDSEPSGYDNSGYRAFAGTVLDAVEDALTELVTHPSPPEGMVGEWISVEDRLPEWAARDDTPCFINGKEVPPTLTSETVLVALKGGGVRTDKLITIEGKSDGWWHTYGERVVAWQKTPAPPTSSVVVEHG